MKLSKMIKFVAGLSLVLAFSPMAHGASGADIVNSKCSGCHATGVLGAPKLGNKDDWAPRIKQGMDTLVENAIKGKGGMPPKGGTKFSDDEIEAAVKFMVAQAEGKAKVAGASSKSAKKPKKRKSSAKVNTFNRLLRTKNRNLPPSEDGIHDPENQETYILQPPLEAFDPMPKARSGNYVDWVKALEEGVIDPRADRLDPDAKLMVFDLNIVREVKGSMPNVVYPHKQHTEWLDCSNCHTEIFIPKKGANQISMAAILLGEKCGVCHGKVAFPVSECRKCHSQKKKKKLTKTSR